jgi:WD40 repeat protein
MTCGPRSEQPREPGPEPPGRVDQRAARTSPAGEESIAATGAGRVTTRVTPPVTTLTTDVVLIGHTGPVNSVAFHPNGRTLASGDVTARPWDLATRQTTTVLTSETGVKSVAFSPDGRTLASASTDRTVRLWDPATGQPTAALFGHTEFVRSAAFSPDGHTLGTAGMDGTVRLWTRPEDAITPARH